MKKQIFNIDQIDLIFNIGLVEKPNTIFGISDSLFIALSVGLGLGIFWCVRSFIPIKQKLRVFYLKTNNIIRNFYLKELPIYFTTIYVNMITVNYLVYIEDFSGTPIGAFILPKQLPLLLTQIEALSHALTLLTNTLNEWEISHNRLFDVLEGTTLNTDAYSRANLNIGLSKNKILELADQRIKTTCILRKLESLYLLYRPTYVRKSHFPWEIQ
jgi:hypothetical protein